MVKYTTQYFDLQNNGWRLELSNLSYLGEPINFNTSQSSGAVVKYTGSDDPFEPVISSTLEFTILKHSLGMVDISEFKNSNERDWSVDLYLNDDLFWTGYLVPEGIMEYYQSLPYDVQLVATDGLKSLTGRVYSTNNWLLPDGILNRSFISHVRDILFMTSQLGKPLPIRWIGDFKQYIDVSNQPDAFTQTIYSPSGQGYTDFNGNSYSSYFILENYLRSLNCRIYQCMGKWRIERIPDITTGTYDWSEIDTTFSPTITPVLTTGTETNIKNIGTDVLVDNGAYTINLPGVKSVTATYEANKSENSLPNGTFDSSLFAPFNWYASNPDLEVAQVDSINGRSGYSAELLFPINSTGSGRVETFALRDGVGGNELRMPLDTATMYKRMSLGFTIMPQNGFPFFTDTGLISWLDDKPLKIRVELTAYGTTDRVFVLNENGFWIPKPDGQAFDRFAYNKSETSTQITIGSSFQGNVMVGDSISFQYDTEPVVTAVAGKEFSGDLEGFLNYAGQFFVDHSFGKITSFGVGSLGTGQWLLNVIGPYASAINPDKWTVSYNLSNTNRDGSINILPEDSKIGDVITINFDKFQGVKLPDFKDDPGYKYSALNWFFYVNQGQKYTLDDVYITFDDNNEVYKYEYESANFTDTLDYSLKIGSSTNGFYTTNIMSSYDKSYLESKYIDGVSGYIGTIQDVFARKIITMRSKSLELFEGKLLGSGFNFNTIYTVQGIDGKKFLPLSAAYNTETSETDIGCVEMNIGDNSFTRTFYGSNDKPLSNEIIN